MFCANAAGLNAFAKLLEKNPDLPAGITVEALCQIVPKTQESTLQQMIKSDKGIQIFTLLLDKNESLALGIRASNLGLTAANKGKDASPSPINCLMRSTKAQELFLKLMDKNPKLEQEILQCLGTKATWEKELYAFITDNKQLKKTSSSPNTRGGEEKNNLNEQPSLAENGFFAQKTMKEKPLQNIIGTFKGMSAARELGETPSINPHLPIYSLPSGL